MDGASVVIDVGTGSLKAELASAEAPKVHANVVGRHKYHPVLPANAAVDAVLGNDTSRNRGLLKLRYPMEHGRIVDVDAFTGVLKHVVSDLSVPSRDHPMLLTEPPIADRDQRAQLAEIVFEQLHHPALLFAVQGVLSLFASGNTTGVVVDVGDGITQACPVVDGYSIRDATKRVNLGGRDVTRYLQHLLRQHGTYLDTSAEFEIVKAIKQEKCQVKPSANDANDPIKTRYLLPDGTSVNLLSEPRDAPEVLFDPEVFGFECPSVVQTASDCIRACDLDLRKQLYESVYLAGGATTAANFSERFLNTLAHMTPRACTVRVHAPADRHLTAWTGASFLAQLSSFRGMLTTKQEYDENGKERLLHQRLFA